MVDSDEARKPPLAIMPNVRGLLNMKLNRVNHIKSSECSIQEKDIEQFIINNPDSLGLGEIKILDSQVNYKESILDILGFSQDLNTYYEIEVMLGQIDHKHIAHCLDYWAREKRKKQFSNHCAVLICESTRGRYSTLLKTLPDFLPLIIFEFNILENRNDLLFDCIPIYLPEEVNLSKFKREPEKKNPRTLLASNTSLVFLSKIILDETILLMTSREMATKTGVSLGATSNIIKALKELNFLDDKKSIKNKSGLIEYLNHILNAFPGKKAYLKDNLAEGEIEIIISPNKTYQQ